VPVEALAAIGRPEQSVLAEMYIPSITHISGQMILLGYSGCMADLSADGILRLAQAQDLEQQDLGPKLPGLGRRVGQRTLGQR